MDIATIGQSVVKAEIEALAKMVDNIDSSFIRAVEMVVACKGNVVVTGVGKPWLIGQKISATMASTGTPSFPLHPAEAAHGDLGRIRGDDIVLAISNSGASEEVVRLLPLLKRRGVPIIGMTGKVESDLAKHSDVILNLGRIDEACPLKLAPSASTTAMLAMGDALALAVMEARGFTAEDYARFHPGGALGRKLMNVSETMRPRTETASVAPDASVRDALFEITRHKSGACFVVDNEDLLLGVFTDGDLRRMLSTGSADLAATSISEVMTSPGLRIQADELTTAGAHVMQEKHIDELPVVNNEGRLVGHLDVQDLLATGFI
ncbi:MAG: KpsF/GutQ family sugar-phosphate isomerase [Planctomycetes bacterium]|nr:KpsF/GutQ family sugar-phosphate isomerase [Planctomycetota bacterium]